MNTPKTITLGIAPFENLSGKESLNLVAKSFIYELITQLSRFRQFQIIVLDSGNHADVDYLIRGSLNKSEDGKLHIHASLFMEESGVLLWANHFEGDDLISMQHNLVQEITASLQQQVKYALMNRIRNKPPVKLKAYECWLHGMEELKKGTVMSDHRAREYFQRAIEIDPDYSLAYSGMSMTYFNEWSCQLWDKWELSQNGAFEWAEKAIILDEENYIAALVLGRVFLYQGAYESSEFYLRKSLDLNSNDPDSLVQVASCFVFLGHAQEAWDLYERAVRLNPARKAAWNTVAMFILFELGEYKKSTEYIIHSDQSKWVDAPGYYAAAYFYQEDSERVEKYWNMFLEEFGKSIMHGKPFSKEDAVNWMQAINPFRYESKLIPFWKHMVDYERSPQTEMSHSGPGSNIFRKKDELWEVNYESQEARLIEVKGFYDLQQLLSQPGQSFHCAELMGSVLESEGTSVIDEKSKRTYQTKILELQSDIERYEALNDYVQASSAREEYDTLVDHLSGTLGLGGKIKKSGRTIDKARSAVTWRIRSAISKIECVHAPLGKHLSNAVKTGMLCTYLPEKPTEWEL